MANIGNTGMKENRSTHNEMNIVYSVSNGELKDLQLISMFLSYCRSSMLYLPNCST